MVTRMNSAQSSRRAGFQHDDGFTLVELLVVVIIIGILAAIAVPVYMGIQNNAKNASVQADLANAKTAVISVQNETATLPAANSDVANVVAAANGYTKGINTGTIKYSTGTGSPFSFCLSSSVVSGDSSKFFVTDIGGVQKVVPVINPLPVGC